MSRSDLEISLHVRLSKPDVVAGDDAPEEVGAQHAQGRQRLCPLALTAACRQGNAGVMQYLA